MLSVTEPVTVETPVRARLFLGLPVPEHVVRQTQAAFPSYAHVIEREVPAEKWHVTLIWLDEVENPAQYHSRLRKPLPQSFMPTVQLTHLGRGRQRTQLWAYAEASAVLLNIRTQLMDRLRVMRFPVPTEEKHRPFVPHITCAHLFESIGGVGLADTPLVTSFSVKEVLLYRSTLAPHGSHYTVETHIPLITSVP